MYCRVFGELELRSAHGHQVLPTASKPRTVFALLLMRANTPVSVDELVDEVWGDRPPATAQTALHCYVSGLRKAITTALPGGADPREVLVTRGSTYRLALDGSAIDVFRQQDLQQAGRAALSHGDHDTAARDLGRAVRLCRGRPLADVTCGPRLEIEARAIEERCLNLEEMHVEAQLRSGADEAMLDGLVRLTRQHPLREGLQAQYVVALHRAGRRAEALAAYRSVHQRLNCEVGVDPGERFRELHRQVLSDDPELTDPAYRHRPVWTFPGPAPDLVTC